MYRLPEPTCNILSAVTLVTRIATLCDERYKIRIPTEIEFGQNDSFFYNSSFFDPAAAPFSLMKVLNDSRSLPDSYFMTSPPAGLK